MFHSLLSYMCENNLLYAESFYILSTNDSDKEMRLSSIASAPLPTHWNSWPKAIQEMPKILN